MSEVTLHTSGRCFLGMFPLLLWPAKVKDKDDTEPHSAAGTGGVALA